MNIGNISSGMTPLQIFLDADLVVQSVIILLVVASAYSWSVIFARAVAIAIERRKIRAVGKVLSSVETIDELRELAVAGDGKVHDILHSMSQEWKWSNEHASRDYDDVRERLASVSELTIEREYTRLAGNSAWLATIGNSAPFFGLLGTVWGIMNSFIGISQAQDTSLAVVAPGMAEALFATAVGLFCAIPASIGYNRIVQALAATDQEWRATAGRVEVTISRQYGVIR
jgi:biopolymer transport protein ExbB/TolQ